MLVLVLARAAEHLRSLEVLPGGSLASLEAPGTEVSLAADAEREHRAPGSAPLGIDTITPIEWLHFPKTGSSFETALAHFACGDAVARDFTVAEPMGGPKWPMKPPQGPDGRYLHEEKPTAWAPSPDAWTTSDWNRACGNRFARFASGHQPLPATARLEHTVALFRDPKARILSGYHDGLHDCDALRVQYCDAHGQCQGAPVKQYAACVGGCMGRMLMGEPCESPPGEPDVATKRADAAAGRVHELGFVGLTEEFDLSVCLWHARFGGECLPAEFEHLRKGPVSAYDTGELAEPPDQAVYEAARKVFWDDVSRFGVSRAACHDRVCASPETRRFFAAEPTALAEGSTAFDWPGRYRYAD